MKCQYLRAELQSRSMLPMSSEYVLQAVSKPKEVSICSFFKSPSIVLGATDYPNAILLGSIVLSENAGVGVRVVTTDDNECLDTELTENLDTLLKLVFLLQLCTARTDDIETTSVTVLVHELVSNLHIVVINETARTEDEAIELVSWVERLHTVEETRDHVVTARSPTARKDNTYVESREFPEPRQPRK